jgi:RimJ/RimL family protein N-acetyltransferase
VAPLPERIETDGPLLIRRWLVSDAGALGRAIAESANHLRPWIAWMAQEPLTLEKRRDLIGGWEKEWSQGGDSYLGVFVDDRVAGSCGLHRRRGPDTLEIGYWIHSAFLRRGLATAVASLLTDAALSVPGITRVEIHHDKANVASADIPRRLGYRFEGEARDEQSAPAEVGVDWTWQIDAAARGRARSAGGHTAFAIRARGGASWEAD